ncbi:MAG: polysaccharide deacetylase family protein [Calditrichaeota bacterium]|nr:polysaccharide deacetylase family protein [Calditrichota bacterium]
MNMYIKKIKRRVARISQRNMFHIDGNKKIVSFTFDDAPASAFKAGAEALNKYNKKGTYYIALSFLAGQPENEDLYTVNDLRKSIDDGHELGCHTYGHIHFFNTKGKKLINENLLKNQQELKNLNLDVRFENFSYPFGEQSPAAKKIASGFYKTCRGTEHGINIGHCDLNNLYAVKLYEKQHSTDFINSVLDEFNRTGGWLIFYTHDVCDDFSVFGCSSSYMQAVVDKCIELEFDIKTISAAAKELNIS